MTILIFTNFRLLYFNYNFYTNCCPFSMKYYASYPSVQLGCHKHCFILTTNLLLYIQVSTSYSYRHVN